jgi:hypothetical protein
MLEMFYTLFLISDAADLTMAVSSRRLFSTDWHAIACGKRVSGAHSSDVLITDSREDHDMKKLAIAGLALAALSGAGGKVHAHGNYPWCVVGQHRDIDCAFSSREQCLTAAGNLGLARKCMQNPFYNPARPPDR